jgi:hypothetical protein
MLGVWLLMVRGVAVECGQFKLVGCGGMFLIIFSQGTCPPIIGVWLLMVRGVAVECGQFKLVGCGGMFLLIFSQGTCPPIIAPPPTFTLLQCPIALLLSMRYTCIELS